MAAIASLASGATSAIPKTHAETNKHRGKLEDDMMYGVNVASCHIDVRMGFIRKVYAILSVQLTLTVAVAALFMTNPTIKGFVQTTPGLLHAGFFVSIGLLLALMVKRHETPTNMYLLLGFTLVEAYTVGTIVTFYDTAIVLQAAGLCAAITVGLTLFTFQTKYDFTVFNSMAVTLLWVMLGVGLIQFFVPFTSQIELIYCTFGAMLYSGFIVIDTQKMLRTLSTDEYIMAAINLYLDIINLFLYILRILNERK
jgi:FtsH-binding integral membrane protein